MFSAQKNAAPASDKLFVEDVFSTYIYTGGADQNIINGIDLTGKGGMVWIKVRNSTDSHALFDTNRGVNRKLVSNDATASTFVSGSLTNFWDVGFRVGGGDGSVNSYGGYFASWTFRKAPKFFDVQVWSGDGSDSRSIAHSLGATPGMVIVKRTNGSGEWKVWFRTTSNSGLLNTNAQFDTSSFGSGAPRYQGYISAASSSDFTVAGGVPTQVNASGGEYIAYLFGHDTTANGLIQCGTYSGNGSTSGPSVNLGWEPQWVMVKCLTNSYNWHIADNMRGMFLSGSSGINDFDLIPNSNSVEQLVNWISPTPTGFDITTSGVEYNQSGQTYLYVAIRRGPMKAPTSGTSVFSPAIDSGATGTRITTNFPIDLSLQFYRPGGLSWMAWTRLTGGTNSSTNGTISSTNLRTNNTDTESATSSGDFLFNNVGLSRGGWIAPASLVFYNFRRAPSFFDVVGWTNSSSASITTNHSLGVVPELVIVKRRGPSGDSWMVRHKDLPSSDSMLFLNSTQANSTGWTGYSSTATTLTYNTYGNIGDTYISYLFASCPAVSKVGSYTGNGSSQTINCGFTAGARFVMIKRTDDTGNWFVWDTARGINPAGTNDPFVSLNTTNADNTSNDSLSAQSTGFGVIQNATTNINVSGATYIYLAIA